MAALKKVAVSGSTGFIGSKLCKKLQDEGYEVWPMVRNKTKMANEIFYDYDNKKIDLKKLAKCDAVIHLAGKNIMSGIWTKKLKDEIYDSRIKSTLFISHTLSELEDGPKILLNASAVGIYGDRADQKIDEDTKPGSGFLAKVCKDWERATLFAKKASVRVVNMRISTVLSKDGGMLKMMIPIFKLALGGILGSGDQYMPYVTQDELMKQIIFLLKNDDISGPVNMVSLEPTTNEEFTRALAKVLHRPVFLKMPAFILKLLGEQGKMLLCSARVYPKVLLDHHFSFDDHQGIETVLRNIL